MARDLELPARALFYLENHEQIEEWHRLGQEARSATAELLRTFTDEFADLADTHGLDVSLQSVGKYEYVFLADPDLPVTSDGVPLLTICFGWNPSWVLLDSATYGPFVAVRVAKGQSDDWPQVRERFLDRARPDRERAGLRHDQEWPAWKRVAALPHWWLDLDTYVVSARGEVTRFVELFRPSIRAALADA